MEMEMAIYYGNGEDLNQPRPNIVKGLKTRFIVSSYKIKNYMKN
jgi:hypothetical protein